jgi:hypothetical protein
VKSSAVKLFKLEHFLIEVWLYFKILVLATGVRQTVKRRNTYRENTRANFGIYHANLNARELHRKTAYCLFN